MSRIHELNERFENLFSELANGNYEAEQDVFDLEREVAEEMEFETARIKEVPDKLGVNLFELKSLLKKINQMKIEFDFYDEEAELDRMFSDRHEADFDEDSMSYESAFGDD